MNLKLGSQVVVLILTIPCPCNKGGLQGGMQASYTLDPQGIQQPPCTDIKMDETFIKYHLQKY